MVPTWSDIEVLESVNKALSPLVEFTDALSGEDYVSVSYLKPVLHLFNNSLLKAEDDDTPLTKEMKAAILEYLNDKYSDPTTDELLDMASLLDPRFKSTYIEESKVAHITARAAAEIESILAEQRQTQATVVTTAPAPEGAAAAPPVEKKPKKTLSSFFNKTDVPPERPAAAQSDREVIEIEIRSYLQTVEVACDTDPLEWWGLYEANFPQVSLLAKNLSIPATSSPSERVFSTSGNIVTCHRASLKPETVDRLVFLAHNLD